MTSDYRTKPAHVRHAPEILRNAIRCRSCGDEIESRHVHEMRWCRCGAVAVDGGREYLRRVGDLDAMDELSEMREDP